MLLESRGGRWAECEEGDVTRYDLDAVSRKRRCERSARKHRLNAREENDVGRGKEGSVGKGRRGRRATQQAAPPNLVGALALVPLRGDDGSIVGARSQSELEQAKHLRGFVMGVRSSFGKDPLPIYIASGRALPCAYLSSRRRQSHGANAEFADTACAAAMVHAFQGR